MNWKLSTVDFRILTILQSQMLTFPFNLLAQHLWMKIRIVLYLAWIHWNKKLILTKVAWVMFIEILKFNEMCNTCGILATIRSFNALFTIFYIHTHTRARTSTLYIFHQIKIQTIWMYILHIPCTNHRRMDERNGTSLLLLKYEFMHSNPNCNGQIAIGYNLLTFRFILYTFENGQ